MSRLFAILAGLAVIAVSLLAARALLHTETTPAEDGDGEPVAAALGDDAMEPRESDFPATPARAASPPPRSVLSAEAAGSWMRLERSLGARAGVALMPLGGGPVQVLGALRGGHAWSTIKVPILVTVLRERGGRLNPSERAWAKAALTASDNEAVAALFAEIERARGGLVPASRAVEATLRRSGDATTEVATAAPPSGAISTYGQTEWSLTGSTRFIAALAKGCLLDRAATRYVLGLMEQVTPEQRWGLGDAGFDPDWAVAFKGGWGPEGSSSGPYLVRQVGALRDGPTGVAVAIAAQADNGSFESGTVALNRIATWIHANLRVSEAPATRHC